MSDTTTGADGSYTMTVLKNATCNKSAYADGASIPVGKYTLLAYKPGGFDPVLGITTPSVVAIQTVVQSFSQAAVTGNDLVAQPSGVAPTVKAMFGLTKNTDGTQTWGGSSTTLPANAAIQVSFSMAMSRGGLAAGISISPAVDGAWSLSPDWLTATFYPDPSGTNKITPNTTYTVTVKGSDKYATSAITNVYGNKLALTATGTFKATAVDTIPPTAEWDSPTTAEMANPVDVIKPIRIRANKQLDVNTLLLEGTVGGSSALGAKSGVLYVGKSASNLYVYEFVLGEPLRLSTNYTLKVSGGKGLNGIIMNELNGSLQTISAALSTGISPTADANTQMAQAQVKDVFGKWVRGFNDRNISQVQSVMTVDAFMEYDISRGFDSKDVNRDGRYSSQEFSTMLVNEAFPNWEYCQTTVAGDVVGLINVTGDTADFEFKLIGTSNITSQQCTDSLPTSSFYATLQKINGAWFIVRFSEGIDTRTRQISYPALIAGSMQEVGVGAVPDGGQLSGVPAPGGVTAKWTWDTVTGVSTYVAILVDARNPENGVAYALPSTKTSISTASDPVSGQGAVDVSNRFGFRMINGMPFQLVQGGQYYYEVVGLASIQQTEVANKNDIDIIRDISALSPVVRFSIAGVYKEITASVYAGASASGTPATYSEIGSGYDLGNASQATIVVSTPNQATAGALNIYGFGYVQHPLVWTCPSTCQAVVTVDLYKGWNWIDLNDGMGLYHSFGIVTTGGMTPVINFTSVKDDISSTALTGDAWSYYTTNPGATKLTISGTVAATDPVTGNSTNVTQVQINISNNTTGAYASAAATVSSGTFQTTVEIYKGDNWINVADSSSYYQNHIGVYTDTGSVWVAPISGINVVTATKKYDWGNSSDWDASVDSDNVVTVSGKFKAPLLASGPCGTYTYNVWSEGASNGGTLIPLTDGSFSISVDLYTGWNYVNLQDPQCNWYGANIYTSAGKAVIKPTVTSVNSIAPTVPLGGGAGNVQVTSCNVTIAGTALSGPVQVNWNGYDGTNYWYESQTVNATGTAGAAGSFSLTMPVVSGSGSFNYFDVYDASFKWGGVQVSTTGNCTYSYPVLAVTEVRDSSGRLLTDQGGNYYDAAASSTVTITGTSTRPGATITASFWLCNSQEKYTTTASTSGSGLYTWTISGVKVYGSLYYNYIEFSDGYNYPWITVISSNNQPPPPPPINITGVSGAAISYSDCSYSQWDATAGGTGVTSITITGTVNAPAGQGNYTDQFGGSHTFTINANGTFSIGPVAVYDGSNDFTIYDTGTHYLYLSVATANGVAKPKFVQVTSPSHNSTGITGVQTVTASWADPISSGYVPTVFRANVQAGVWDTVNGWCTYNWYYYSSDPYEQVYWGDLPVQINGSTITFDVDFDTGQCETYIDLVGYDTITYINHGNSIYVNPITTMPEYWYKPGIKKTTISPKNVSNAFESLRHRLSPRRR